MAVDNYPEIEKTRYSAEWYERILNSLSDMVLVKGEKSKLLWANKSFLDVYGMTNEELKDLIDGPQSDPDDTVQYVQDDHYVHTTGNPLSIPSEPVTTHEGGKEYYHTIKVPVFDDKGKVEMTVGISRKNDESMDVLESLAGRFNNKGGIKLLRKFLERLPFAILMLDQQGRILGCSDSWKDLLGEEGVDTTGKFYENEYAEVLGTDDICGESRQVKLELKNGVNKVLEIRNSTWQCADGEEGGRMIQMTDITTEEAANAELMVLNERLSLALEASDFGVWDWDIATNTLVWDEKMYIIYGVKPNEFSSAYESWEQGVHPEDREASAAEVQEALERKQKFDTEFRIIHPERGIRCIRAIAKVFLDADGSPERLIGVNWDVTDEREMQKALEHANKSYGLVSESAQVGIWEWTIETGGLEWTPIHYQILGYKPNEIEVSYDKYLTILHPEDHEKLEAFIEAHLNNKKPYELEIRMRGKNGEYRWYQAYGKAMFDDSGKPVSMTGSVQDIHDRKLAAQAIEKKNEELSQFAYRTSHDLKAPLLTIQGLARMAGEDLKEGDIEEVKVNLQRIIKNANRLEDLISDILQLSQIDHIDEQIDVIQIKEVLEEVKEKLWFLMEGQKVELLSELGISKINTQKTRLIQILENLISNGIKYRNNKRESFVKLKTWEEADYILLEISDNGIGIPESYLDKVYDMFTRFHQGESFGSGLGMYLVKKNIDNLGGNITVMSTEAGTAWTVRIPKKRVNEEI